jgi:hypothetical protein
MSKPEPKAVVVHPDTAKKMCEVVDKGKLPGGLKVYTDPLLDKDQVLVMKSAGAASMLDTGYIHAPYIPLQVTPTVGLGASTPKKSPLQEFAEATWSDESIYAKAMKHLDEQSAPSPFFDPGDFSMRKGLRTRYAAKLVNPDFFGTVKVTNL